MTPNQLEEKAVTILRIYQDAETAVFSEVARRIADGIEEDGWAEQKSQEIRALRRRIQQIILQLEEDGAENVEDLIEEAFQSGHTEAVSELKELTEEDPIQSAFAKTNQAAVAAVAEETTGNLKASHFRILRTTEDHYRQIIARATGSAVAGGMTRRQAAQIALNQFANRGITGFVDNAGRHWDLASYAEMSTRSALARSMIESHTTTLQENGRDLVIISDSPDECELCRPYEGEVFSLSGSDPRYKSLSIAVSGGLFHPGCTHRTGIFIPGLTKPLEDTSNAGAGRQRQQQRYLERGIRHWKKRETVAITNKDKEFAKRKRKEWQQRTRDFIDETDRRRRYDRESTTRAR
jgi:hypothetical protein